MSRRKRNKPPSSNEPAADSAPPRPSLSLGKKIAFSLATLIAIFAAVELLLRVARIGEAPVVGTLRFGYDEGIPVFDSDGIEREGEPFRDVPLFEADPRLFWKPIANTPFTGENGLRLATPTSKTKDAETFRLAVIGDSCSFLGEELYPNRFARMASNEDRNVDVVNASCPGYTSFQGRRRLEDVWAWDPDMVAVYFGWNDHWKSLNGQTDRQVMERQQLVEQAQTWLGKSRLFWWLYSLRRSAPKPAPIAQAPVRVPLDDYRDNLRAIVQQCEERGCEVALITAPSAFLPGYVPDWAYQFFGNIYHMSAEEISSIPATHARYNEVVREVAESSPSAFLVDIARTWSKPEELDLMPQRFRGDRIHLTEDGHQAVAEQLLQRWREEGQ
jgi:lysophospholipase L1-like esterase